MKRFVFKNILWITSFANFSNQFSVTFYLSYCKCYCSGHKRLRVRYQLMFLAALGSSICFVPGFVSTRFRKMFLIFLIAHFIRLLFFLFYNISGRCHWLCKIALMNIFKVVGHKIMLFTVSLPFLGTFC